MAITSIMTEITMGRIRQSIRWHLKVDVSSMEQITMLTSAINAQMRQVGRDSHNTKFMSHLTTIKKTSKPHLFSLMVNILVMQIPFLYIQVLLNALWILDMYLS